MKNKMKELKKGKYIIGVSGGPDSMALLAMCIEQGLNLVVAHMNYQLRDTADRDMDIVEAYCEKYGIPFAYRMQNKKCVGNFQAFARDERYKFYKELLQQYHGDAVLLAHHMDDHLETYLMQKQRASIGEYMGIREETCIMECPIIRPLLQYTKKELTMYCIEHMIPYGIDESNLSDHYTRNRIRHSVIDHMSDEEKIRLCKTIASENLKLIELRKDCSAFLQNWDTSITVLQKLDTYFLDQVLIQYIYEQCNCYTTYQEIEIIRQLILHNANNWTRDIKTTYDIYNEYGKLCIDTKEDVSFSYTMEKIEYMTTPYFKTAASGSSTQAVSVSEKDFPLTIRNALIGDCIALRFGTKKVNRWFIDRKIPKKERKRWPVVVNALGKVILVPKIGCDIEHFSNNPSFFVLK